MADDALSASAIRPLDPLVARWRERRARQIVGIDENMHDAYSLALKHCADELEAEVERLRSSVAAKEPQDRPSCRGCGGPHPFDTTVPSVRWNAVIRTAGLPDYLCLTCIVTAFVKAGESFTAELVGGEHHFEPIEIRTRSQNATDAQAISRENTYLRARLGEAEIQAQAKEGTIMAVVHTVGGIVEGAPTHRGNFLQRIEELLDIERREQSHRQSLKTTKASR